MTDLLFAPYMTPFAVALGLLFGLMTLELIAALLGGTLMGLGGGEADLDVDVDVDVNVDMGFDAEVDIDADVDAAEAVDSDVSAGGLASVLGMGKVPFLIWLGAFLLAYGLGGYLLQSMLMQTFGWALPAPVAGLGLVPVGLGFARQFGGLFARLIPKTESSALSENHLGRTRGVVTVGTAARGKPAQVRITDRHGNFHYVQAEPVDDTAMIAQGTEVLVLRKMRTDTYRITALPG